MRLRWEKAKLMYAEPLLWVKWRGWTYGLAIRLRDNGKAGFMFGRWRKVTTVKR